ncbi:unnamed protein product [Mytilus edulis]|uniref:Ig-like domain-containing protein n=1 Tax=Mytilus edulis TaxID=6550 RepID=A0A8S3RY59_MYTED|nr:unnamed protein product [Mytilus edulis]
MKAKRQTGPSILSTFPSCKNTMYNKRKKNLPVLPKTVDQINIDGIWTRTTKGDPFLLTDDNTVGRMLIFSTQKNLTHLSAADIIYGDGTFYTCPSLFFQLYTFHTMVDGAIGQILAKNENSSTDASCRCDYRHNYDYVKPPKDPVSVNQQREDCSCYIRKCENDKIMIADYRCMKNVETILPEDIKCPTISRIIPPEEADTVYRKQFSQFQVQFSLDFSFSVPNVTSILLKSQLELSLKGKENEFMILNGDNVTIECNVESYIPVRSVSWQKVIDGEIIQIIPSENKYKMDYGKRPSLSLTDFNADDEGKYRCIVRNSIGLRNEMFVSCRIFMSRFGWLTRFVTVLQHIPAFHTEDITLHNYDIQFDSQSKPTVYNVYKGDDITMEQHSNAQQKLVVVKWFKESDKGTELDRSNEQYSGGFPEVPSLTINATTVENAGKYFCLLIYDNKDTQKALFKLKIIPQEKSVTLVAFIYFFSFGCM